MKLVLWLCVLLAGCGGIMTQDYAGLTDVQAKAKAGEKGAGITCGNIGTYGRGVHVDADFVTSGKAAVNTRVLKLTGSTCDVEIREEAPIPVKAAP